MTESVAPRRYNGRGAAGEDYTGPPQTYRSLEVIEAVGHRLHAARRSGLTFAEAWGLVVTRPALQATNIDDMATWRAIRQTKPGWERAFNGAPPTPGERAAGRLLLDETAELLALDD